MLIKKAGVCRSAALTMGRTDEFVVCKARLPVRQEVDRYFSSRPLMSFQAIVKRPIFVASPEIRKDNHTCDRCVRTP